jgi:SAM-dependent methyltransferase
MESYQRDTGSVLELGPFSGGISIEMTRLYPGLDITIGTEQADAFDYLWPEIKTRQGKAIKVKPTNLNRLAFADSGFDLIAVRGAFFFLNDGLLKEIFRVLKPGGLAFVGGGYGKGIPQQLIDEIHNESQVLNDRLGRKWVSVRELKEMVDRAGLADNCHIVEEGGLWLNIQK